MEDYRRDGREAVRALTGDLRLIQSRDELIAAGPKIKARYHKIVDLMIGARQYYDTHPGASIPELLEEDHDYSVALRLELKRVMMIEGAESLMAKYQEEALNKLHLTESRMKEKKLKK